MHNSALRISVRLFTSLAPTLNISAHICGGLFTRNCA
jgi:hypothetical protein